MPQYNRLRNINPKERRNRIANNLLKLRKQLRKDIETTRTTTDTLLLATWNIRDFGANKFNPRPRLAESYFYIAEIISHFDIVAVQEVNRNMSQFRKLMRILGNPWTFICTDTTEGRKGNQERLAYVYDRSKVNFRNISGEIVLQKAKMIDRERQFARTPFQAAFQSRWFKFNLCTVHIYYADDTTWGKKERVKEIKAITKVLSTRAKREKASYILLGDFNIIGPKDITMDALLTNGFTIPKEIWDKPTAPISCNHYDQIAFKIELGTLDFTGKGGTINFYESIFRDDEANLYIQKHDEDFEKITKAEAKIRNYKNGWRTWQMSDHLPMWIELRIDFADDYLNKIIT